MRLIKVLIPGLFLVMLVSGQSKVEKPKVLLELFTSKFCPNCPTAEQSLAFLQREQPNSQAEIITLAYRVDYGGNSNFADEFASRFFTQRQEFYARTLKLPTIYTPQIIIDGQMESFGNSLGKIQQKVSELSKQNKTLILIQREEEKIIVKIRGNNSLENSTIYLAIAESGIASSNNSTLKSEDYIDDFFIVRELRMLGILLPGENSFQLEYPLEINKDWKKDKLKFVIFIQEIKSRKVTGINTNTGLSYKK